MCKFPPEMYLRWKLGTCRLLLRIRPKEEPTAINYYQHFVDQGIYEREELQDYWNEHFPECELTEKTTKP